MTNHAMPLGGTAPAPAAIPSRQVVLLVEDDDTLRSLTRMMLEDGGFEVIDRATPAAALQVLNDDRARVDLLMTDVKLAGMSGADLVGAAQAVRRELPVVYVTGWDRVQLHAYGIPAHALVLVKPFMQGDLIGVTHRALWSEPREEVRVRRIS